ncbi:MAG: formylglycine-generating enzyme family protein [Bacteroidia bacterium]|nr:formylglycine-generating enzyme family protein [Bacteroidia bacterium]
MENINKDFLSFVRITPGEIQLNDDRIKKKWNVKIDAFFLSRHLVTQKLYFDVTGAQPSSFKGANRPVENVSWIEAVTFCNKISLLEGLNPCYTILDDERIDFDHTQNGYRLPTEAEWQYACQVNSSAIRYGKLNEIAWYKENSKNSTHDVGLKQPNKWGLYDMLGNVWEWCSDVYDETVYGSYRIFRGGGWADEERGVMATNRRRSHPNAFRIDDLGFRIAKNID